MKKRGLTTMVAAVLVFILDFFTLVNDAFTTNPTIDKIGIVIGILAAIAFVIGLIDFAAGLINKK